MASEGVSHYFSTSPDYFCISLTTPSIFPPAFVFCCAVVFHRVRELMAAKWAVEKYKPFNYFSSGVMWDEISGVLGAAGVPFPPLTARRIKHLIVELYIATKEVSRFTMYLHHVFVCCFVSVVPIKQQ